MDAVLDTGLAQGLIARPALGTGVNSQGREASPEAVSPNR
jgi:hypothetical protein